MFEYENNQENKHRIGIIILAGLFLASLSFLFIVTTEKNFKVTTDFLIVQNQTGSQDFYSLSRSADYIGSVLNKAIYSELFINEVVKTGKVDSNFLPINESERLKDWSKMVRVSRNSQLGIITVEVFGNDQRKTIDISEGIIEVMKTKNYLFRGKFSMDVRVLSGLILEKNPSFKNIVLVVAGGFVVGIVLSGIFFYYFDVEKLRKTEDDNQDYIKSLDELE